MSLNILPLAIILLLLVPQLDATLFPHAITTSDDLPGIKKFNSLQEIKDYLDKNTLRTTSDYYYDGALPVPAIGLNFAPAAQESAGKSIVNNILPSLSSDYSTTNVQVAGVDEADFVKNDGKYIYIISDNKLVIVDAFPASKAMIISQTDLQGTPNNLFLDGDYLVVFTTDYSYQPTPAKKGVIDDILGSEEKTIMPPYHSGQTTHALVYSIKNKAKPVLVNDIAVEGNYFNARMIDGYVYLVTKDPVYYSTDIVVPEVSESGDKWVQPDVYYFNNPESSFVFHTVTSFKIFGGTGMQSKTFLMGQTNTMYVSEDNIYISYPVYNYNAVPVRSSPVSPVTGSLSAVEDFFNGLTESQKGEVLNDISPGVSIKPALSLTKTVIHKLAIDKGSIDYRAKGQVPGTLLNQFALDEYGGNLRVATTVSDNSMYNNVCVLDKNMKDLGSLVNIAPGEKIYSTRFMGDRLYMVTYKTMDPFFVIDLSRPSAPKVLGELKLPGFSDYLQPYDARHVIGIGRETTVNKWGGAQSGGLKLALFDVSDVSDPQLVDQFVIGDSGTDSEALRDQKAFLFDKNKGIVVLPVKETSYMPVVKSGQTYSQYMYWDGAYVFDISPTKGISLRGTVVHDSGPDGYYGSDTVRRSLYIDNTLYTISTQKIVMSDLSDLSARIGEIKINVGNYGTQILYE
jgi:inhibitor of cysteine peptidase